MFRLARVLIALCVLYIAAGVDGGFFRSAYALQVTYVSAGTYSKGYNFTAGFLVCDVAGDVPSCTWLAWQTVLSDSVDWDRWHVTAGWDFIRWKTDHMFVGALPNMYAWYGNKIYLFASHRHYEWYDQHNGRRRTLVKIAMPSVFDPYYFPVGSTVISAHQSLYDSYWDGGVETSDGFYASDAVCCYVSRQFLVGKGDFGNG